MKRRHLWLGLAAGSATVYGLYRAAAHQPPLTGIPAPNPAPDYAAAVAAAEAHIARSEPGLRPECAARVLTHGAATDRSIVLLHGFTNCPRQYVRLAEAFFERGYNVFVPRFPYHGLYNRAPQELANLTAEDLARTGNEAVDIARGLGRHVTVFGLSMGGLVTAWLAETRSDIDRAVLAAPAVSNRAIPDALTPLLATYFRRGKNRFRWWNPDVKGAGDGPGHIYYGFPSRGFSALLRLSTIVWRNAEVAPPRARSIAIILNPSDESIDDAGVRRFAQRWRRQGANIAIHEFPANWQLIHDIIDPAQPLQQIDRVYPRLIEWTEYPYYVAAAPAATE
ncbi:MAG: alpha/beta fold hydrolase [Caldilinea sp.]|nr:alpha/beta fold hydrolase [Caldilinea sp.]